MLTIGTELKLEIERYCHSMVQTNPLLLAAEGGAITAEHIRIYVDGIRFQIVGAMRILRHAEARAEALGDAALAAHYHHKFVEEHGHDLWAEQDLRNLPPAASAPSAQGPSAIDRLLGYLDAVVERDPSLYLSYILFVEYLTVLVGPRWLETVEAKCGIPKSMISVVGNHVELDKEHVTEGVCEIDRLVTSEDKRGAMLGVLRTSISYCEQFWDEVLSLKTRAA